MLASVTNAALLSNASQSSHTSGAGNNGGGHRDLTPAIQELKPTPVRIAFLCLCLSFLFCPHHSLYCVLCGCHERQLLLLLPVVVPMSKQSVHVVRVSTPLFLFAERLGR